jgi:YVTN family beta-propeller protein
MFPVFNLYKLSGPGGPQAITQPASHPHGIPARDSSPPSVAYLPPTLRELPFMPPAPAPMAQCDPSMPDVFQTVHTNAQVTRISTCPFQIKAQIPVVTRPLQIQITPDGSTALVTSFDHAVNFIDVASNRVTFTLTTQPSVTPNGLAIAPDGSKAYITGYSMNNSVVQVIDLKTRAVTATFPTTIPWAQSATLTPDGSQLWVNTDNLDSGVDVFDTLTNTLVTTLNIVDPTDIAFNSTGTVAYITSSGTTPGTVYAINTATFQTITTYTVGPSPADIAMSYGDQFLVVNNGDGTVTVIDLRQKKISSVKIGSTAVSGIAFVK